MNTALPPTGGVRLCRLQQQADGTMEGTAGRARVVIVPDTLQLVGAGQQYWLYLVPMDRPDGSAMEPAL